MDNPSSSTSEPTSPVLDLTTQMRLIPPISHLSTDLRGPISRAGIRHDLALAQKDGFDPKDLYEKAVLAKHLKGDTKYPAPSYSEVDPNQPLR